MNRATQRKGDVAVAFTIAAFTKLGWDISKPLTESAAYDLIADTPEGLKRVQVKYSSQRNVDLRHISSRHTGNIIRKSLPGSYDWLVVYYDNKVWLHRNMSTQSTISVSGPRFELIG